VIAVYRREDRPAKPYLGWEIFQEKRFENHVGGYAKLPA
jgi:hypothetical protein